MEYKNTLAKPGDELIFRSYGTHSPYPDGEHLTATGYGKIYYGRVFHHGYEPGLYKNTSWIEVANDKGTTELIYSGNLQRKDGLLNVQIPVSDLRIGDLPEKDIWEWDVVRSRDGEVMKVLDVDYAMIGRFCNDGVTPMGIYRCQREGGGYSPFRETEVTLVERGNVWKVAHGQSPIFSDLEEEKYFALAMSEYEELRNPKGSYGWTQEEGIQAISDGEAHEFFSGNHLVRYKDNDLGERIRQKSMEKFGFSVNNVTP